ncbi:hypothetical protein [Neptuniibacter sp. QD37_11]|uniref:hypothetical protein n=1 Tax=Neptuniibacter sp. QD37_11 TaxID=3398209 RepID=UPI0039F53D4F
MPIHEDEVPQHNKPVSLVKVVCHYNRNLKMSPEKLAAQVSHAVMHLNLPTPPEAVAVLQARAGKFNEYCKSADYVHHDRGYTELAPNTPTVCAKITHVPHDHYMK